MTRPRCMAAAARVLADAIDENAETYARGGARAVAEAAWLPGGPSLEWLAAHYEGLIATAEQQEAAA